MNTLNVNIVHSNVGIVKISKYIILNVWIRGLVNMSQATVVKYLEKKGLSTCKAISEALDRSTGPVSQSLKILIRYGEVEKIMIKEPKKNPVPYYRLIVKEE